MQIVKNGKPMLMRQLRSFIKVAELKSISKASQAMHIAQPALSRQIRRLEQDVGVQLLYRDGRGTILTAQGEEFYTRALGIVRQADQLFNDMRASRDEPTGEVAVGILPMLGADFLAALVREFRSRYPKAEIKVTEGLSHQIAELLYNGAVDVGFVYGVENFKNLNVKLVMQESLYLVGPKGDDFVLERTVNFGELAKLPLLLPEHPSSSRNSIEATSEKTGVPMAPKLQVHSIAARKELIKEGEGYSIMPFSAIHTEIEHGILGAARIVEPEMTRSLAMVTPQKGILTLPAKKLIELAEETISEFIRLARWHVEIPKGQESKMRNKAAS